jgi:UDP-glucose 4-epimerase
MKIMNSVLITGAAGYVGITTSQYFLKKKLKIFGVDNFSTGNNTLKHKNFIMLNSDFCSLKVFSIIRKNNIKNVIHLAALIDSNESVLKPKKYYKNNYHKMNFFLNECIKAGVKNFIFSSSAAVYGNTSSKKISENALTKPISPYGKSKLLGERLLIKNKKIKYGILRYFNIAGPSFENKFFQSYKGYNHLFKILADKEKIIKNNSFDFTINGKDYDTNDGSCLRDFVHVQDIAKINYYLLKYLQSEKSILINCCTGIGSSVIEILNLFKKYSNKNIKSKIGARRAGDPAYLVGNNKKLKKIISFNLKNLNSICKDIFAYIYGP